MNKLYLLFLVFFFSFQVFAGSGKAVFIKGEVLIKGSNNKFIRLKKNQDVNLGDMIRTKTKSIAVLALKSGSKLKLNENSAITLRTEKTAKKPESLFLNKGSVFISVLKTHLTKKTKKTKKTKIKLVLKTRSAAMGVRGTKFFASFGKQANKSKRKDLWMCVNSGLVEVRTTHTKKSILVKAGEGVHVKEGTEVSEPKPLMWTKKLNWGFDSTKGDLTNKVEIEEAYTDLLDKDYD